MQKNLSFLDVITQYIEAGNVVLPVLSSVAMRVQQELVKKEPEIKILKSLISQDQSLSSQVLQMANSAFYHGLVEIKTIEAAIIRLGMREVGRITLLAATKNQFRSTNKSLNAIMHKLWQHSVGCALGVQWLSKRCKLEELQKHAFFAGLFHDVGKLFVLMMIEQMKEKNKDLPLTHDLLMEAMTVLHAEQGYNLMKQWNLPEEYCVTTRDHHKKDLDDKNLLLLMVRISDMACLKLGIGVTKEPSLVLSACEEAQLLNLSEIDLAELEISLEDTAILAG
ncbi:MAG: HDOD domain-containing protein [Desulfobulbaceae bacterium]|nr:HDOD domain-containing protein [Desulfobulbaceae bacterium]